MREIVRLTQREIVCESESGTEGEREIVRDKRECKRVRDGE